MVVGRIRCECVLHGRNEFTRPTSEGKKVFYISFDSEIKKAINLTYNLTLMLILFRLNAGSVCKLEASEERAGQPTNKNIGSNTTRK